MQSAVRAAQEFVQGSDGFVSCLREMRGAARKGIEIDFSDWDENSALLLQLEESHLDALIDVYREYLSEKCKKSLSESREKGVQLGRRPKKLPKKFYEEVERWNRGEISGVEGARNCNMAVSSFYDKSRELGLR